MPPLPGSCSSQMATARPSRSAVCAHDLLALEGRPLPADHVLDVVEALVGARRSAPRRCAPRRPRWPPCPSSARGCACAGRSSTTAEPVAAEQRALGADLPVALQQLRPGHGVELGEALGVAARWSKWGLSARRAGMKMRSARDPGIDEAGPHPLMAEAAGVGGAAHAQRHLGAGQAAQAAEEVEVLALGELGELVEADVLQLGRLVAVLVALGLQIAEGQAGAARESSRCGRGRSSAPLCPRASRGRGPSGPRAG